MLFGNQLWVLFEGVGAMVGRSADLGPRFYDGLAKAVARNITLLFPKSVKINEFIKMIRNVYGELLV